MKILIVDDHRTNRKLLRVTLEAEGHTILEAGDGLEALKVLDCDSADAIVSDVLMPRMDGYRLCLEVRKNAVRRELPFVFYTSSYTAPSDELLARQMGADVYIRKPASAHTIIKALENVVNARARQVPAIFPPEGLVLGDHGERLIAKLEGTIGELTRRTAELQETKAKLDHLLSHTPAVIYLMKIQDGQLALASVSANIENLTGFKAEELLQPGSWLERVHPQDRERLKVGSQSGTLQEETVLEYRFTSRRGQAIWIHDSRRVVLDASNQREIVGSWTDITARKTAETAVLEAKQFNEQIISGAQEGIIVYDRELVCVVWNPLMERITGLARDQAVSQPAPALLARLGLEGLYSVIKQGLAGDCTFSPDFAFRIPATGRQGWFSATHAPLRSVEGEPIGVVATFRDITERRQAEDALAQSENHLRAILESEPECVKLLAADGTLIQMNPAGLNMIEADSAEQAIGQNICHLVLPEHQAAFMTLTRKAFASQPGELEFEIVGLRGTRRWLHSRTTPLRDGEGRIIAALAVTRDVSDRRRTEAALRASEERFRQLAENINEVFWITDAPKNQVIYVSPGYETIWGRSCQSLYAEPQTWSEAIHPEDRARVRDAAAANQISGNYDEEFRIARPDGSIRWVRDRAFPIKSSRGEVERIVGLARDITDQRDAENALRHSEERFRSFIENASDLITVIDRGGLIQFQSPSSQRVLGFDPAEFTGRKVSDFVHPDDLGAVLAAIERALSTPASPISVEARLRHRNGSWRLVQCIGKHLPEEGDFGSIVVNSRDITEARKLEEQLRQAQKMEAIGQLAAGVAHDFNNLLTVISGHSELLLMSMPAQEAPRESLTQIRRASERAAGLTRQLLAFSRQQVLEPKVLDLNTVIADTEKILRRLIGEDVLLDTILGSGLSRVKVDPTQIDQVILNLAVNSRDAMPRGGKLTIETRNVELDDNYVQNRPDARPGSYVLMAVTDTGTGMGKEVQARIFEPFFTTKGVGKGTGLGLAVVHGIVKQSGGHIAVYSEPGVGTVFKIYLPAIQEAAGRSAPKQAATDLHGTETILLAEDEEAVRAVTSAALQRFGYQVLKASGGAEALDLAQQAGGKIDLLVTDVVMPEMSGPELAIALQERFPGIKVLFLSGYTDDAIVRHGILQAGVAFLQKPFIPSSLARKVREVLNTPGSGRAL